MHWIVLAGAYVILWFLMLQILLPIGIRAPHESGEAAHALADSGAPPNPHILFKAALATLAAAVLWLVFYALILAHVINL
jgi:predicted secreted protein